MVKRFSWLFFCLLFSVGITAKGGGRQYNSYKGLVMAGYQGWFNTPDDGSGRGWHHYNGPKGFRPGSCSIDFLPRICCLIRHIKSVFVHTKNRKTESITVRKPNLQANFFLNIHLWI